MNTKIRNFITPLLLISCFYINASLNQVIDVISSFPSAAQASNVAIPPIPAAAQSLQQFVLPFGDAIDQLWFSPVFEYNQQQWAAQLPFHGARSVFKNINAAAMQGHTIQFKFQKAEDNEGNVTGLVTAIDLSTNTPFDLFTFDKFSEYLVTNTQTTQNIPAQAKLVGLNITYQPVNGTKIVQGITLKNNIYSFAIVPGAAVPHIATNTLILRSSTITNLTVVALNSVAQPSTYFMKGWSNLQEAVSDLTSGETLDFEIKQGNVTCTNNSNIPKNSVLSSALLYLVVAEDSEGYIAATVTNKIFSISVNDSLPTTNKSNIILPANNNPIKLITMYTTTANQGKYTGYAYLPTYLPTQDWMPIFQALKMNTTMTNPLEVTMSNGVVTFSNSQNPNIAALTLTNRNATPNTAYILLMQDANSDFHYAIMDSNGKIIIQVKK